jgi:hypothetical protein
MEVINNIDPTRDAVGVVLVESIYHLVMAEKGAFLPTNNKLPPQHFKKIAQI